jgi:hypothetical protein
MQIRDDHGSVRIAGTVYDIVARRTEMEWD